MPKPTNKKPFYSDLSVRFLTSGTINTQIETLSELFTEWFLYDSTTVNTLETFIANNNLGDIFSADDFRDIICGTAYLDETLTCLVPLLLPFKITPEKIRRINDCVAQSKAREIKSDPQITAELIHHILHRLEANRHDHRRAYDKERRKRPEIQEQERQRHHEYYINNKPAIREKQRKFAQEHPGLATARGREYRKKNPEAVSAYQTQYRKKNAAAVSARKKKCYNAKKEEYQAKHKAYYEQHREEIAAQQRAKREKEKTRDESAKSVCPTYLYLLQMRHDHRADYLKLFGQRNLVTYAIKTCPALQEMDSGKCAFCTGNNETSENCPMYTMAQLPDDATDKIREQEHILAYRERRHAYYIANREYILSLRRQYAIEHQEEIKAYRHKHYVANKKRLNAQGREYSRTHREQNTARQQRWRAENRDARLAYEAEYRQTNAEAVSARKKKCYHAKKEEYQAKHKAYYEQHREEIAAQQRAKHEKEKIRDESAKSVCPTFLYLLQMRYNHRADYLKLFGQRNLIGFAIKKCPALQEMDFDKCAFCVDDQNAENHCALYNMAELPSGAPHEIINLAQMLKEKAQGR